MRHFKHVISINLRSLNLYIPQLQWRIWVNAIGTYKFKQKLKAHVKATILYHHTSVCETSLRLTARYSNIQSHGNFGNLDAGHGK